MDNEFELNPLTGEFDLVRSVTSMDLRYLKLDGSSSPSFKGFTETSHYTGFPNRTDTTISFVAGTSGATRTLTISGTNWKIYISGVEYTIATTLTSQISPDDSGLYWFWITAPGGVPQLNNATSVTDQFSQCLVATVYWNTTTDLGILSDERHWMGRDRWWHEYTHQTIGSRYASGMALTLTGSPGGTTFSMDFGEFYDEDIEHLLSLSTTCKILYKNGDVNWAWDDNSTALYKVNGGTGKLRYNNSNALADVANNDYVAVWVFASANVSTYYNVVIGQRTDGSLALSKTNNTPESLALGTLPSAEMKLIYRIIYRQGASSIVYQETADYRASSGVPITSYVATDHSTLSNLGYATSGHTGFEEAGLDLRLDQSGTPQTVTGGAPIIDITGIGPGTVSTVLPALDLINSTASTNVITTQASPALILSGQAWVSSVDTQQQFAIQTQPSTSNTSSKLRFYSKAGTSAWVQNPLVLTPNYCLYMINGIGDTAPNTSGFWDFYNSTNATVLVDQASPIWYFDSYGWKTAATAGSQEMIMGMTSVPEQGVTNPIGTMRFLYGTNVGGISDYTTESMRMEWGDNFGIGFLGAKTPQLNSVQVSGDMILADQASLGSEKITNGGFGSAVGWTEGSAWTITDGYARKDADFVTTLSQTSAAMVSPLVVGETYLLSIRISNNTVTDGSVIITCGGATRRNLTTNNETTAWTFTATSTADLVITPSTTGSRFYIYSISLKKITGGDLDVLGTLSVGGVRGELNFGSSNVKIKADSKYLYFGAGDDASITFDGNSLNIVANAVTAADALEFTAGSYTFNVPADTDIALNFTGTTNSGVLTWMEDEDYFKFSDGILMNSTAEIFFRDTAIYINSIDDGHLDLTADVSIDLNANTNISAKNIITDTTTGTKIGTDTAQKIGFWNATPVVQQVFATGAGHTVDELIAVLQTLGLVKQS